MANPLVLPSSVGLIKSGLLTGKSNSSRRWGTFVSRSPSRYFTVRAAQDTEGPRRLVDIIRIIPEASRNYFRSPSRRALFGGISLLGGFYVAQTISLSFGALGVNDVFAAVLCVLITEYVTRFYYSRPKGFPLYISMKYGIGGPRTFKPFHFGGIDVGPTKKCWVTLGTSSPSPGTLQEFSL